MPDQAADEPSEQRVGELVAALAQLRGRIADACARSGRDPREVTLVAVTKTRPAADVVALCRLGVRDIGENRDQEAAGKVGAVAAALASGGTAADDSGHVEAPRWHFLGRIQSRKCRSIAGYAACVHSVDRAEVADRIAAACAELGRPRLPVFVQLSLDGDPQRGGVVAAELPGLAARVAGRAELELAGVMAVAPVGADPDAAFAAVWEQSQRLRGDHHGAVAVSAGMSADLEAALRHGATHVRIGSALLGRRAPVFG